jgi:hypothetical protein
MHAFNKLRITQVLLLSQQTKDSFMSGAMPPPLILVGLFAILLGSMDLASASEISEGFVHVIRTSQYTTDRLAELPKVSFESLSCNENPNPRAIKINTDTAERYQTILGFGGAFTEAAAINYFKLEPEDRQTAVHSYFAKPSEGGHAYSIGRVHINSCDFSPESYNFDPEVNDTNLVHFDDNVTHDTEKILPFLLDALAEYVALHIYFVFIYLFYDFINKK